MASASPEPKRQKRDYTEYTLNINTAVDKEYEKSSFSDIARAPVVAVEGIAERGAEALNTLGVKTVRDLGEWKYYKWAKAITALAAKEVEGGRAEGTVMNIDQAVMKEYEKKSLKEVAEAPVHALQGVSEKTSDGLATIFVKTVEDLANSKFAAWCEAIATLADVEQLEAENRMLKKLE
ncbi:unnamed protein product [Ostreobium quekettii]|uniref:Uncharacterized protein n=1 Tax=Ostreobium quekettii TaxID=121088 RepID=A0A8S1J806_9CHLO|nr:unnamed protein product [Ostreobium quekettii]|eukprot:evm.model.scf_523.4 EVM.evm.TU.scf_523.4   scf_523:47443-49254(+)